MVIGKKSLRDPIRRREIVWFPGKVFVEGNIEVFNSGAEGDRVVVHCERDGEV